MIELDQILHGLIQRTTDGKLKWHRSVHDDQFVTSVDAISIVIREVPGPSFEISPDYRLEILDENGQTVEVLHSDYQNREQYKQLQQLFVLARRLALNIDSVLQKLAEALEL
jgi:hypothetical protein